MCQRGRAPRVPADTERRKGSHDPHDDRTDAAPLGEPGTERVVRREQPVVESDPFDDRRRRQREDDRAAGRPRRRRRVGMGVGHHTGRGRSRHRLRQHHRHDPRRLLAGQLRRLPPRHHDRRATTAGRAARFLYALFEGFCLGAISAMFDAQTEGIVGAAVLSTLCVFVVALLLYVTAADQAHPEAGVRRRRRDRRPACLLYFFVFILSIFNWGWLYSDNFRTIGVVVTLIAIVLAALSLVLDFGTIEAGVSGRRAEGPGVVHGLRADGHADLAVHLDPQAAGAAVAQPLSAPWNGRPPSGRTVVGRCGGTVWWDGCTRWCDCGCGWCGS